MKDLFDSGLLFKSHAQDSIGPGGHYIVAFDNCPGQNKNNFVLRMLCAWLVEMKVFKKVTVIFLVKGHTKNPCNYLFNALKRAYRRQNIETFAELLLVLNVSSNVTTTSATTDNFHDYNTMFTKIYLTFPPVLKYHLFESSNIHQVSMQLGDDHPKDWTNLRHPKNEGDIERAKQVEEFRPEPMVPPGIKVIKQMELWKKF